MVNSIWGMNMFAANGEEWRIHRRIISPAFSNATYVHLSWRSKLLMDVWCSYASVWTETVLAVDEMIAEEGWANQSVVEIPSVNHLTAKVRVML